MDPNAWVSLRKAADLLGVHPSTVRLWADHGQLTCRRTPGGHRRFLVADLARMQQQNDQTRPLEAQAIVHNALGQTAMNVRAGSMDGQAWYEHMHPETRVAMRTLGREALDAVRRYLAEGARPADLAAAAALGRDYAGSLMANELSLTEATRGFFFFNGFLVDAVLTWSELGQPANASGWATLLRQVSTFTNTMLLSIIETYEAR
jgi:excisionase family DNA binding protein